MALHHFVELTYNGIVRRLLVSAAKGTVVSPSPGDTPAVPSASSTAPDPTPAKEQVFALSRTTQVVFKAPGSSGPAKARAPTSTAKGGAAAKGENGDLPGYEQIGGLENQIELIREMVEWPLTRPELYTHFGALRRAAPLP